MTTWWSPSLVFQSLEVSNSEFLYCALAKVWPKKGGDFLLILKDFFISTKLDLASILGLRCVCNDTVCVLKGGSIVCLFRIFTVSFQALDLLLWQAAHLQHTTLQATFRTRSGLNGWGRSYGFGVVVQSVHGGPKSIIQTMHIKYIHGLFKEKTYAERFPEFGGNVSWNWKFGFLVRFSFWTGKTVGSNDGSLPWGTRQWLAGSLVQKGDFIEETLGIAEREDIIKNGFLLCIEWSCEMYQMKDPLQ